MCLSADDICALQIVDVDGDHADTAIFSMKRSMSSSRQRLDRLPINIPAGISRRRSKRQSVVREIPSLWDTSAADRRRPLIAPHRGSVVGAAGAAEAAQVHSGLGHFPCDIPLTVPRRGASPCGSGTTLRSCVSIGVRHPFSFTNRHETADWD